MSPPTAAFPAGAHDGSKPYDDAGHGPAAEPWREVRRRNSFLELARSGLGTAAFRQGDYQRAMDE